MPFVNSIRKPKVLIFGEINESQDFSSFSKDFDCEYYDLTTKEQFVQDITTIHSDVDAFWCMYNGFLPVGGLTADLVAHLPPSLRIVVTSSVGFDPFDVATLGKRGIAVCNSPGLAAGPVADHALYLTLGLYRYSPVFEHILRKVKHTSTCRATLQSGISWDNAIGRPVLCRSPDEEPSGKGALARPVRPSFGFGEKIGNRCVSQPRGHTVGIAGFGAIGREIGARLHAVGMRVHYTKRAPLTPAEQRELGYPATYHASLDSLLPHADLLVLALPLTAATKHVINDAAIAQLPAGARVVNIGRGALIDTPALLRALRAGRLHGAALDVFEDEPAIDDGLCSRWDVILTPHIGSSTHENVLGAEKICMDNICRMFGGAGDTSRLTIVNEEYLKL